jgi:replicative DNA helicase
MGEVATTTARQIPLLNLGDRPLPHSNEAEIAVLGSMLLEPTRAVEVAIHRLIYEDAFYRPAHREIFKAIVEITNGASRAPLDPITLSDFLERAGRLEEVGGRVYISELMNKVPTAANVERYVEIVHQNAVLRRLIATSVDTVMRCFDAGEDVRELIDNIESEILAVTNMTETKDLDELRDLMLPAIDYLDQLRKNEQEALGISTGFTDLDHYITGLREGEMFVLAARPSIGKTALALNMAANIALRQDNAVGFFSLEMPSQLLAVRLLCSESRIGITEIRETALTRRRWDQVMAAGQELRGATFVIDDTGGIDILELRAKARRMKREHDIRVLFIDYLQLIRATVSRNSTRENEVSQISGAIKALAKELSIPIVVLAQLNRQAEQPGQRPKLSHLRESGAIEQDADVVALLHRDREQQMSREEAQKGVESELIIAKNRNGETGLVNLTFFPAYTRFESPARIEDDDIPDV